MYISVAYVEDSVRPITTTSTTTTSTTTTTIKVPIYTQSKVLELKFYAWKILKGYFHELQKVETKLSGIYKIKLMFEINAFSCLTSFKLIIKFDKF